jgi:maltooligosyltrehalose trehalohydrolase
MTQGRRYPIGAELMAGGGAHFRVWAPKRRRVDVVLEGQNVDPVALAPEANGYFSGAAPAARPGSLYRFRLDGVKDLFPDPASRFQPDGPHGPSQVIDPAAFHWSDERWAGVALEGQVVYELHVGTFTREGTWAAAAEQLAELRDVGITLIEVMPVADFPGRFGWGYDGVNMFAPTRLYGAPDDFRRFVDRAHTAGIGVILDVVYNHFGPDGNYLGQYSDSYVSRDYDNEWGDAINFDGASAGPVREFFAANAAYWVDEYHLDGLRLDATQQIFDDSPENIMTVVTRRVREAAQGRKTIVVAENEPQLTELVRPVAQGGCGMDALWNDDFHHSAKVALTGHNEAYYSDHLGSPQEFISAVKYGYLFQGQIYSWQEQRRGTPALDLPPAHFVIFTQNHDQVANSGRGLRAHLISSPGRYRALTALLLLAPNTPMLFQGQEFAASAPFHYFADHHPELARQVAEGRVEFMAQFPSVPAPGSRALFCPPHDPATFEACKLDFAERSKNEETYAMHRDLLRLRREDPVFRMQKRHGLDGAVLGPSAFVLRWFADDGLDRLLFVNLGRDLPLRQAPEPLLAPPRGHRWALLWSSEDVRYGGGGTPDLETEVGWIIPGEAAAALVPRPAKPGEPEAPRRTTGKPPERRRKKTG